MSAISTAKPQATVAFDPGTPLFAKILDSAGVNIANVDVDGALKVSGSFVPAAPSGVVLSLFAETLGVGSLTTATLLSYTVPALKVLYLTRIDVSGNNIAKYDVLLDAVVAARKRTWMGSPLNESFDFNESLARGVKLLAGQTLEVKVLHERPYVGDFEARLQGVLADV